MRRHTGTNLEATCFCTGNLKVSHELGSNSQCQKFQQRESPPHTAMKQRKFQHFSCKIMTVCSCVYYTCHLHHAQHLIGRILLLEEHSFPETLSESNRSYSSSGRTYSVSILYGNIAILWSLEPSLAKNVDIASIQILWEIIPLSSFFCPDNNVMVTVKKH